MVIYLKKRNASMNHAQFRAGKGLLQANIVILSFLPEKKDYALLM